MTIKKERKKCSLICNDSTSKVRRILENSARRLVQRDRRLFGSPGTLENPIFQGQQTRCLRIESPRESKFCIDSYIPAELGKNGPS